VKRASHIGRHIARLRTMRGWSQETMAAKMQCLGGKAYDMTRPIIGNIESGRHNIYHWQIEAIHDVFGCTYDEIFLGPTVNAMPAEALFKKPRARRRRKSSKPLNQRKRNCGAQARILQNGPAPTDHE